MPVYNAGIDLVAAIRSIQAQTIEDWELIVLDDASTDQIPKILKRFAKKDSRIKICRNRKNLGVAGSLNRGLRIAKGEFIARMDADDISLPKRFEKQLMLLKNNPDLVAVGTQTEVINEKNQIVGEKRFPVDSHQCSQWLMSTVPIQHPTLMVRAEVMKKCPYESKLKTAEDWDLYFQLLRFGKLGNTREILYQYRQCLGSNGFKNLKKAFITIFKVRIKGIFRYGYRPNFSGILTTLAQAFLVIFLPEKLIFNLFNLWRVKQSFSAKPNIRFQPQLG